MLSLIEEATRVLGEAPSARAVARRLSMSLSTLQGHLAALHRKGSLRSPSPAGIRG